MNIHYSPATAIVYSSNSIEYIDVVVGIQECFTLLKIYILEVTESSASVVSSICLDIEDLELLYTEECNDFQVTTYCGSRLLVSKRDLLAAVEAVIGKNTRVTERV